MPKYEMRVTVEVLEIGKDESIIKHSKKSYIGGNLDRWGIRRDLNEAASGTINAALIAARALEDTP